MCKEWCRFKSHTLLRGRLSNITALLLDSRFPDTLCRIRKCLEEFGFLAAAMASSLVVKMRIPLIKFPSRIRICATTPPTASSPDSVKGAEVKASPSTGIETGSSKPLHSGKGGGE